MLLDIALLRAYDFNGSPQQRNLRNGYLTNTDEAITCHLARK